MKNKNCISFTVLLYDDRINETFDKQLNAYIFLYDRSTNLLKILCINSNVVFLSKNRKIESLKKSFNKDLEEDVNSAINNFNFNLASIIGNIAITDFYIGASFRKLDIAMNMNKKNNSIILKNNLINNDNDIEFLNCFEIIDCILHLIPSKFINIINNYDFFDTNISDSSFLLFFLRLLFLRPIVVFYEIPIKYSNNCKIVKIRLDNENFLKFLNNACSCDYNFHINKNELFINVRNASKIPMAAKKVSQILRKNNFDVLDWGNFFKKYNKTLIKDYKGNLMHALK
ncbi:MAG: LytR C-terminal domain-containing protein, partial [Endomicrobium sp.]|nr:LytR C-terminal domain-containing protein [Endomicrobium sp.]